MPHSENVSLAYLKIPPENHHVPMQFELLEARLKDDVAARAQFLRFPAVVLRQYGIPVTAAQEHELQQLALRTGGLEPSGVNVSFVHGDAGVVHNIGEYTAKKEMLPDPTPREKALSPVTFTMYYSF